MSDYLLEQELPLTSQELEEALRTVNLAWLEAEGLEVELKVPRSLYHLTMAQWEIVCQLLTILQEQQAQSQIH